MVRDFGALLLGVCIELFNDNKKALLAWADPRPDDQGRHEHHMLLGL